jgi:hypothetical protein
MPETATVLDDPAPWVALLPENIVDADPTYADAVRVEGKATARHNQILAVVADLEAKVAGGAADSSVDPTTLVSLAAELAGARALKSTLAPIPVVPQARHDFVASMLPRPNPARFFMPRPVAFLGELVHYQRLHAQAGELPPVAGPLDLKAIKEYERVAALHAQAWATLGFLDKYGQGVPMGSFVAGWSDTVTAPRWDELLDAIKDLIVLITRADAARPPAGSCGHGQHSQMRLQAAQPQERWSYEDAVRRGVLVMAQ